MPKTRSFINLDNLQKFTINDGAKYGCHDYQIIAFIFHNASIQNLKVMIQVE
jgi:hypothetical protein